MCIAEVIGEILSTNLPYQLNTITAFQDRGVNVIFSSTYQENGRLIVEVSGKMILIIT